MLSENQILYTQHSSQTAAIACCLFQYYCFLCTNSPYSNQLCRCNPPPPHPHPHVTLLAVADIEPLEELEKKRITRIVTDTFPSYFALVSRVRVESKMVGPDGAILSSTVVPQAQAVFPELALKKATKIGLQVRAVIGTSA